MLTVAIHSPNNLDILIAMHDALVICGYIADHAFENYRPDKHPRYRHLCVYETKEILFMDDCLAEHKDEKVTLTRENFGDVLNFVLLCQIWEE